MKFLSQFLFFTFIAVPFILVCVVSGIVRKSHEDALQNRRGDK